MDGDARVLAAWLSARADAELERLFAARGVPAGAAWHDFFDAAEGLLDDTSIDRALARLPRTALIALHDGDTAALAAAGVPELALADQAAWPYARVRARVRAAAQRDPAAFAPVAAAAPRPASAAESAAAAERVFDALAALSEVLITCARAPLGRTGARRLSALDRRRLADAGVAASGDVLDELVDSALTAGLLRQSGRALVCTDAADRWLHAPHAARWEQLVTAMRAALPDGVRTAAGGCLPVAAWSGAYPLDPDWPTAVARHAGIARLWGLTAGDAEPEWAVALREGRAAEAGPLVALLPHEVDRVYLQADLTAIAPGPLAVAHDLRLRAMAVRESRAQASSYRFTAQSVASAVAAGETAASLREFLAQLSLTGIPQPLDYLIEREAARHGLVRVTAASGGGALVTSEDSTLLDTIAVDQSVRAMGLVRTPAGLRSRLPVEAVHLTLADARYPVAGSPPARHERGESAPAAAASPYARLIGALRSARTDDPDAAWLARELDAAVRARAAVRVTVSLPDGSDREFVLEATGLGAGRFRGRDRGADTERTLPLASIVRVQRLP